MNNNSAGGNITRKLMYCSTKVKLIVDSHNFGRMDFSDSIMSYNFEKSINAPGSLSVNLAPHREYLDLIEANDVVNLYVNLFNKEESIDYNKGWVRRFFGYVNDIRLSETVSELGVYTALYSLSCSDFQKAINSTSIYNNPYVTMNEAFGANLFGSYMMFQGAVIEGNPRFFVMNLLAALLGFGRQWVLPVQYKDLLTAQPNHAHADISSTEKDTLYTLENFLAQSRKRNDIILSVQTLRELALKFTFSFVHGGELAQQLNEARTRNPDISAREIWEARRNFVESIDTSFEAPCQLTIDNTAYWQLPRTLYDILCFDYMEYTDGFTFNTDIWNFQGTLFEILERVSHPILNELIFDLRPTIDFAKPAVDGNEMELDGALAMVPCVVLREKPFTYYPCPAIDPSNIANRLVNVENLLAPPPDTEDFDYVYTDILDMDVHEPAIVLPTYSAIDISSDNGTVDWVALAGTGVLYAMIRMTVGMQLDSLAAGNISAAIGAGIKVGVYHEWVPSAGTIDAQVAYFIGIYTQLNLLYTFTIIPPAWCIKFNVINPETCPGRTSLLNSADIYSIVSHADIQATFGGLMLLVEKRTMEVVDTPSRIWGVNGVQLWAFETSNGTDLNRPVPGAPPWTMWRYSTSTTIAGVATDGAGIGIDYYRDVSVLENRAPAPEAFYPRNNDPFCVVLHTTQAGGRCLATNEHRISDWLESAKGKPNRTTGVTEYICTHFLIRQNGVILNFIPAIKYACWHAGSWNYNSVGIDLDVTIGSADDYPNNGAAAEMPAAMIASLQYLLSCREFCNLPVVGHGTHTTLARHDPGLDFDWDSNIDAVRAVHIKPFRNPDNSPNSDRIISMDDVHTQFVTLNARTIPTSALSYKGNYRIIDVTVQFVGADNSSDV
jgi:hypothetical protein